MPEESKPAEVAGRLLGLSVNSALNAFSKLALSDRAMVLECVAEAVDARPGEADDSRMAGTWLLREHGSVCVERSSEMLLHMALSRREPNEVRILSLDSIETLWLAGTLSAAFVEDVWTRIRDDSSLNVRCRWLRVLAEAGTPWSVSQLAEALETREPFSCILGVLSNCSGPLAAPLFELLDRKATEGEHSRVREAGQSFQVVCTRARAMKSQGATSDDDAKVLTLAGEFALLHKLLLSRRLSTEILAHLRDLPVSSKASKSQRRFLRMIKEQMPRYSPRRASPI
jgi:hypothetical protein